MLKAEIILKDKSIKENWYFVRIFIIFLQIQDLNTETNSKKVKRAADLQMTKWSHYYLIYLTKWLATGQLYKDKNNKDKNEILYYFLFTSKTEISPFAHMTHWK